MVNRPALEQAKREFRWAVFYAAAAVISVTMLAFALGMMCR